MNSELDFSKTAICLFTFNRLDELKSCIASLELCEGVNEFDIIVFSDGGRNDEENNMVKEVRDFVLKIRGLNIKEFKFSEENVGLANSIIRGLNDVFMDYEKAIILEDDLIVSRNFIGFMKQALDFYEKDKKVFSISGYSPTLGALTKYSKDYYFTPRASSWGLATWRDRWLKTDWNVETYNSFKRNFVQNWRFSKGGVDLPGMLRDQMKGRINSWAIRAVYSQFLNNQVTVYPTKSKVKSIGFGKNATHTKLGRRFETTLDISEKTIFTFEEFKELDSRIMKDFRSVFSIWNRFKDYISQYD